MGSTGGAPTNPTACYACLHATQEQSQVGSFARLVQAFSWVVVADDMRGVLRGMGASGQALRWLELLVGLPDASRATGSMGKRLGWISTLRCVLDERAVCVVLCMYVCFMEVAMCVYVAVALLLSRLAGCCLFIWYYLANEFYLSFANAPHDHKWFWAAWLTCSQHGSMRLKRHPPSRVQYSVSFSTTITDFEVHATPRCLMSQQCHGNVMTQSVTRTTPPVIQPGLCSVPWSRPLSLCVACLAAMASSAVTNFVFEVLPDVLAAVAADPQQPPSSSYGYGNRCGPQLDIGSTLAKLIKVEASLTDEQKGG